MKKRRKIRAARKWTKGCLAFLKDGGAGRFLESLVVLVLWGGLILRCLLRFFLVAFLFRKLHR